MAVTKSTRKWNYDDMQQPFITKENETKITLCKVALENSCYS